jgi:pimeloyl-ACP methyl ester carboxylesterase
MFTEPKNWSHHTTWVTPDVKIHHVDVQPTEPNGLSIVLIHGFPQTWYSWRHMMQPLADLGYRVIAVDYRGAGDSNHPAGGYDKMTMAQDIHTLYRDKLHIEEPIVFGTDIGSMVAVSLAIQFEEDVLALVTGGMSHTPTMADRAQRLLFPVLMLLRRSVVVTKQSGPPCFTSFSITARIYQRPSLRERKGYTSNISTTV